MKERQSMKSTRTYKPIVAGAFALALIVSGTARAQNLLQNPGFEEGSLTGWTANPTDAVFLDTTQSFDGAPAYAPHEGTYHVRFQGTDVKTLSQEVTVSTAGAYSLSMWVMSRLNGSNQLSSAVTFVLRDDTDAVVTPSASSSPDFLSVAQGTYVNWTREYGDLAAGTYTVEVASPSPSVFEQGWVDDFSLTESTGASSECDLLSFEWNGYEGVIDQDGLTVTLQVPLSTNVGALAPTLTVSPFATVEPESGATQDFTSPVDYVVTAQDETTTKTYAVTVVADLDDPTNYLANPGFEEGSLASWTNSPSGAVFLDNEIPLTWDGTPAYAAYEGTEAVRLQGRDPRSLSQTVILPSGNYALGMWVMSRMLEGYKLGEGLTLVLLDDTSTEVTPAASSSPDFRNVAQGTYVNWTRDYTGLAAGTYTVKVSVPAAPNPPNDFEQGWVDDFSLTLIPEPSIAMLGGLGLLGLLRRRR